MVLGYVFSRYPVLSETFILREMLEMERLGHRLVICPLRQQFAPVRHARVHQLRAAIWFPAFVQLLAVNLQRLARQPARYLSTLLLALWYNRADRNQLAGVVIYWPRAVAFAEHCEGSQVEHVHAHYATHPALVAWVVHRLTRIPYSFTAHAHDIYCHNAMLRVKSESAGFVAAISAFNAAWLHARCRRPVAIEVIRCGVECDRYAAIAARRQSHAGPLRVLSVGSLQPYKGHAHLIAACAELPQLECRILGGGPLRSRLERQIRMLGLQDRVTLGGPATEDGVAEALAWADVFALASVRVATGQMEGIPVALMEAMASGLPVVATRLSGIPELVEPGYSGWLVPPADAAALARALERLGVDPGLRQRMGARGRQAVAEKFNLATNAALLSSFFTLPPGRSYARSPHPRTPPSFPPGLSPDDRRPLADAAPADGLRSTVDPSPQVPA